MNLHHSYDAQWIKQRYRWTLLPYLFNFSLLDIIISYNLTYIYGISPLVNDGRNYFEMLSKHFSHHILVNKGFKSNMWGVLKATLLAFSFRAARNRIPIYKTRVYLHLTPSSLAFAKIIAKPT